MASLAAKSALVVAIVVVYTCNVCNAFTTATRNTQFSRFETTKLEAVSRRLLLDTVLAGTASLFVSQPAIAAYGDSSNMKGFDYIEFLMEKNEKADPSTFVYQGADRSVQLQRIKDAIVSLEEIPAIAHDKKWSQVNGVLTGPLGTLVQTMNQVVTGTDFARTDFGAAPPVNKEAKAASLKVKNDLYAIGQAATKKNEESCIQATDAALQDLEAFVKVAF